MTEHLLPLPPLIDVLIASGRWPATAQESLRQNIEPFAAVERITEIAPDESGLYLYAPPFRSVASDMAEHEANGWQFWAEYGAVQELDPSLALILGDFGLGSDAPILLDFRHEPEPTVIKLSWLPVNDNPPSSSPTTWVRIAEAFDEFARRLGLV